MLRLAVVVVVVVVAVAVVVRQWLWLRMWWCFLFRGRRCSSSVSLLARSHITLPVRRNICAKLGSSQNRRSSNVVTGILWRGFVEVPFQPWDLASSS